MGIKKIIFSFAILMACVISVSAKSKEAIKCTLTLLNGEKVSGYITKEKATGIPMTLYGGKVYNATEVIISATPEEKGIKYKADDAKELVVFNENGEKFRFLSLYTTKPMTAPKNLRANAHRSFWMVVYEGKNLIGFGSQTKEKSAFPTYGGGMTTYTEQSYAYSYCAKGDDVVVTYYVPESGITIGLKKNIRYAFERFPKMDEYLSSDKFDLKSFKKSPFDLLKVLDSKVK